MNRTTLIVLMTLAAAFAGCTGADDSGAPATHTATARTIAPGATVAFPLVVNQGNDTAEAVQFDLVDDAGLDVELPRRAARLGGGSSAAYVNVTAPADAGEGEREVVVRASLAGGPALLEARLPVTVAPPEAPLAAGDVAQVRYTGRLVNGAVFDTNDPAVANSSLPKADMYQPRDPAALEPLQVRVGPRAGLIRGFVQAVEGLDVGHSVTVEIPPHLAYGNATVTGAEPRVTAVDRDLEAQRAFAGPRQQFQGLVNASSEVGDRVTIPQRPGFPPFVVTHLNDTHAELTMDVAVGERYTHYQAWPGSSEVVNVTNASVAFRITPTTGEGEAFTWFGHWPGATVVANVSEDRVTLRHTPDVGLEYQRQTRTGQAVAHRVVSVGAEAIMVERENPEPLAGETLVFDITVVGRS